MNEHTLEITVAVGLGLSMSVSGDAGQQQTPQKRSMPHPIVVSTGLQGPETALYDAQADIYIVSNVNGGPSDKDDNGFISRIAPDGTVQELKWIDGASTEVTLHGPKGMALRDDVLVVADIDTVRLFDRKTGQVRGDWPVPNATFVNDVSVAADGAVYATDTAIRLGAGGAKSQGTAAVHRFDENGQRTTVAQGPQLNGPNGIVVTPDGPVFVTFLGSELVVLKNDKPMPLTTLPQGQLDGIARLDDGSYLVSSWEAKGVFHTRPGGPGGITTLIIDGLTSPAGIHVDTKRQRVLIPQLMENRLQIVPLGPSAVP